MGTISANIHF